MDIEIKQPTQEEIDGRGIKEWPVWEKEPGSFKWYYSDTETCYFLEGEVEVELPNGKRMKLRQGDLAVFPLGLSCKWHVHSKVKKHFKYG